jgi:hypothetical protein
MLFNDELVAFLAARKLRKGRQYRIDRTDVGPDVPVDAPVEKQLSYCQSHLLRLNAREGVFPLDKDGFRSLVADDIVEDSANCVLDAGWYTVESDPSGKFRWIAPRSTLVFPKGWMGQRRLFLDVEPGPAVGYKPCDLRICDRGTGKTTDVRVERRQLVSFSIEGSRPGPIYVELMAMGNRPTPIANEPRQLALRVFRVAGAPPVGSASQPPSCGVAPLGNRPDNRRRSLREMAGHAWDWIGGHPTPKTPAPAAVTNRAISPIELHFGAAGDFTLMAREHWFAVRGHAELATYSLHIDTLLCYQAHYAGATEEVLNPPMRAYHIEHGNGSGWTPEGKAELLRRLADRGVPVIADQQLMDWAMQMQRTGRPLEFNGDNWGLSELLLNETEVFERRAQAS